jgi:hypothetical protein
MGLSWIDDDMDRDLRDEFWDRMERESGYSEHTRCGCIDPCCPCPGPDAKRGALAALDADDDSQPYP